MNDNAFLEICIRLYWNRYVISSIKEDLLIWTPSWRLILLLLGAWSFVDYDTQLTFHNVILIAMCDLDRNVWSWSQCVILIIPLLPLKRGHLFDLHFLLSRFFQFHHELVEPVVIGGRWTLRFVYEPTSNPSCNHSLQISTGRTSDYPFQTYYIQ